MAHSRSNRTHSDPVPTFEDFEQVSVRDGRRTRGTRVHQRFSANIGDGVLDAIRAGALTEDDATAADEMSGAVPFDRIMTHGLAYNTK